MLGLGLLHSLLCRLCLSLGKLGIILIIGDITDHYILSASTFIHIHIHHNYTYYIPSSIFIVHRIKHMYIYLYYNTVGGVGSINAIDFNK